MADQYPAAEVSLRSASPGSVVLQAGSNDEAPSVVGTVESQNAAWMVHPGAVYLHEARQYLVRSLDLNTAIAALEPVDLDYYTEPQRRSELRVLTTGAEESVPADQGLAKLR
jgi:DEAD/DEAH box helicase domain-containing protein